jgi:hypothetical protein
LYSIQHCQCPVVALLGLCSAELREKQEDL